jgi:hypothetical protein
MDDTMKLELSNWMKDYSKINYNEDWKLCVDLTYKWKVKTDKVCRKWLGNLKNYLSENDINIDGFFVTEYDKNFTNLHNHLLVWSSDSWSNTQSKIFNYWKRIGSLNISKYDVNSNYTEYMTKYIGRERYNSWDLISNI